VLTKIRSTKMEKIFKIDGMSCQHCVMAVKKAIQKLDVKNLDVKIGEASVEFDESKISEDQINKAIEQAGYIVVK
jgi:copper chaperone